MPGAPRRAGPGRTCPRRPAGPSTHLLVVKRGMQDTCRLYADLAWLFPLDMWRRVLRETGFEVHEGRYNAGDDEYPTFACVKTE